VLVDSAPRAPLEPVLRVPPEPALHAGSFSRRVLALVPDLFEPADVCSPADLALAPGLLISV
jgi:hypothetical protein